VRFEVEARLYTARTEDISVGGCYILSPAEVKLRSQMLIEIRLTPEQWLPLRGLVMHHYPNQGFGFSFEFSSDAEAELIARVVKHLDKD
jgi:hypothetical protein